jgi:hypothetical protein
VVRPGGRVVITFSNRYFPTKVIQGWAQTDDRTHVEIVALYLRLARGWTDIAAEQCPTPPGGDPLFAVFAVRAP